MEPPENEGYVHYFYCGDGLKTPQTVHFKYMWFIVSELQITKSEKNDDDQDRGAKAEIHLGNKNKRQEDK